MRGTPTYTQHSVAWPKQTLNRPGAVDELNVSFDADGGTNGEFKITFYEFGTQGRKHPACKIEFFGDGYHAFRDVRFQRALESWSKQGNKRDLATPAQWIKWLDREGFQPSSYHRRGTAA